MDRRVPVGTKCCVHLSPEAERHARQAGDSGLLGRLVLARWLDAVLDGKTLAEEPLAGVSPTIVARTPELALVAAAEACRRSDRETADRYRDAADRALGTSVNGTPADPPAGGGTADGHDPIAWRIARLLFDMAYGRAFGDQVRACAAVALLVPATVGVDAWAPRARRLARLRGAELDIAAGGANRARHTLEDLVADQDARCLADEAAALLALLDAAAGHVIAAEERAAAVLARSGNDLCPGVAQAAQLALALCRAQQGEPRGAANALAAVGDGSALAARPLRSVHEALAAALRCPAQPMTLGDAALDEALANQVLVALGFVEVRDTGGKLVRLGDDGERAVADTRRWLAGLAGNLPGRPPAAVEEWLRRTVDGSRWRTSPPGHPRTLIEARILAAMLSAEREGECAQHHLTAALELAATSGVRAPFATYRAHVRPVLERRVTGLGPGAGLAMELADWLARPESAGRELELI